MSSEKENVEKNDIKIIIFIAIKELLYHKGMNISLSQRGSSVVSTMASRAKGTGIDPRLRQRNFPCPNMLSFMSFAGLT